ncbi:MAG: succinyldiaminopimelate transaminase [Acidimicrobiia bacterium]|nr:succinyldiaminopimelate transaminase [Acidimicrobiia bacterium]
MTAGFVPPPYPHDRLADVVRRAEAHEGGAIDLSIGTPCDPPAADVVAALAHSDAERGYPPSIGTPAYRAAAAGWLGRRFGIEVDSDQLAATIGTKEFVAGLPHWLRLRRPECDTVLHPALAYPTYAMGAQLAGARAVPVAVRPDWSIDVDSIDPGDVERALCLWVNTPGNPAGGLDDLERVVAWGRAHDVLVVSDECYIEFTWQGPARSVLHHAREGVLAVHSLSKRSNLAGTRAGFYAGDPDLVTYLREVRKHAGFMVPGPVQAAAVVAFDDDGHVDAQREIYRERLAVGAELLARAGLDVELPMGGFYLWAAAPDGDAWALTRRLAEEAGVVVSPGDFYGPVGAGHVRLAMVQPVARLRLAVDRLGR